MEVFLRSYYRMRKARILSIMCFWVLQSLLSIAQAPQISYGDYRFLTLDSTIIPFGPVNKGGTVPQRVYSQTSTFAGNGSASNLDGNALKAGFNHPAAIALGKDGTLFIADEKNNSIRKISRAGIVTTIASGFNGPTGIATDQAGNLYVADCYNHRICKINLSGQTSIFAGSGRPGSSDNKNNLLASFRYPVSVATDIEGNVYVSDEGNNKIRKITPGNGVTTLAGNGRAGGTDSPDGKTAEFNQPAGLTADAAGNVYVADQLNHKIRKIAPNGSVSTFAGTGFAGSANHRDRLSASFNNPRAVAIGSAGSILICDTGNQLIRCIDKNGEVTTIAGSGISASSDNSKGTLASFFFPNALIENRSGLFVADYLNNKIRKIETTGYEVNPSTFPPGLKFDYTTGMISGKPSAFFAGQTYRITAYNSSGSNSTTLTLSASAQPGNALNFDGTDDIVVVQDAPILTPGVLTAEMWIKPGDTKKNVRFLLKRIILPGLDDSYSIGFDTLGHFTATIASGTGLPGSQVSITQKQPTIPDKWYFIAAVFSESRLRLYVDGELEAEATTGFPIFKGKNMFFNFDRALKMTIDEVRLFNHDRAASIVADMMHPPAPDEQGLIAYYDFNVGTPSGRQNSGYNILYDGTANKNNGELQQFFQGDASTSNWIESYAMVMPVVESVSGITSNGFTVNWSAPLLGKADYYLVDVSADRQFKEILPGYNGKKVIGTQLHIDGLRAKTQYFYRLRAARADTKDEGGNSPIQTATTIP